MGCSEVRYPGVKACSGENWGMRAGDWFDKLVWRAGRQVILEAERTSVRNSGRQTGKLTHWQQNWLTRLFSELKRGT